MNSDQTRAGKVIFFVMRDSNGKWARARALNKIPDHVLELEGITLLYTSEEGINLESRFLVNKVPNQMVTVDEALVLIKLARPSVVDVEEVYRAIPEIEPSQGAVSSQANIVGYSTTDGFLVGRKSNRPWLDQPTQPKPPVPLVPTKFNVYDRDHNFLYSLGVNEDVRTPTT